MASAAGNYARRMAESSESYWERADLVQTVLDALAAAGLDLDRLDVDQLAVTDQFHGGGKAVTLRLAELAGLADGASLASPARVLDVGGGLGGPARMLATRFGCTVTALDLTPSYVEVAQVLTGKVGLADRVQHLVGDALDLPFDDGSFDVVWTQNSGMNIADKETLYRGFARVLRRGGTLAFQEPMAGEVTPLHFPIMWADDESSSFLRTPEEMRSLIGGFGFLERAWEIVTETTSLSSTASPPPAHSVQRIIMGEARLAAMTVAGRRNLAERRVATVHGVFTKE